MKKGLVAGIILTALCQIAAFAAPPTAVKGYLDISSINLSKSKPIPLNGEWRFFWKQLNFPSFFISEANIQSEEEVYTLVPGPWDGLRTSNGTATADGYGTYRLLVKVKPGEHRLAIKTLTASTSMRIWVNGDLLIENGKVGMSDEDTEECYKPSEASFRADANNMVDIVVQVANWKYRKGGLWERILIGSEQTITMERTKESSVSMFLFGSLFIMALYHFGLYFFRKKDRSPLVFGFACLIVAIRTLVVGDMPIVQLVPNFPWELQVRLEFLTIYFAIPLFPLLLQSLYSEDIPKWFTYPVLGISVLFSLATLLVPISISNKLIVPYEIIMILIFVFGIFFLIRIILRRRNESIFMLAGFFCVVFAASNDILYINYIVDTGVWLPFGLLAFVFFQAISLSSRFSRSFYLSEVLSDKLASLNSSLSRFVPHEFLQFLNKNDITEVELGDQVQRSLTILFADIRGFTTLSETLDPKENFDFLNTYLQRMGPIIRAHGGIVDKYIGDAIMALFPGSMEDAIRAAIAIQKELCPFNEKRKLCGGKAIEVGIGIHHGEMMLGTIGETDRMETTVISDAVNLASRIEDLTKKYNAKILLSETVFQTVNLSSDLESRFVDRLFVKGKTQEISIYEIIEGDREHAEVKLRTRDLFHGGIILFQNKKFNEAKSKFQEVLDKNPKDQAAIIWMDRCIKLISAPVHLR